MQVVMNKCFFHLNPKKNLAQIRLVVFEKTHAFIQKTMVSESLKLSFNLLTAFNWLLE